MPLLCPAPQHRAIGKAPILEILVAAYVMLNNGVECSSKSAPAGADIMN
jgi:hypothetical protein